MSVRLFLGVPGAGKTQAMCDLTSACAGNTYFVVDRANEWADLQSPRWRKNPPKAIHVEPTDISSEDTKRSLVDWFRENSPAMFIFGNGWKEPLDVAELAKCTGDCTYVDDEIDLVAIYSGWNESPLRDFVHRGRHSPDLDGVPRELHILGAARRPQNLHTDLTSMADEVMTFRVSGKHTLKRVVEEGYVTDETLPIVRTMPNFHYYLWRNTGEIVQGVLDNPFKGMKQK
jgi:hypothetical protein